MKSSCAFRLSSIHLRQNVNCSLLLMSVYSSQIKAKSLVISYFTNQVPNCVICHKTNQLIWYVVTCIIYLPYSTNILTDSCHPLPVIVIAGQNSIHYRHPLEKLSLTLRGISRTMILAKQRRFSPFSFFRPHLSYQ